MIDFGLWLGEIRICAGLKGSRRKGRVCLKLGRALLERGGVRNQRS